MTDEAHEFLEDIRGKKRIARGAKYRKGHKGRKGCVLPSDFLTKKQLTERNGPIMTVKLDAPMTWDEFKALSRTLQSEYLLHLRNTYNISIRLMAIMFGVNPVTVSRKFTELGIPKPEGTRASKSKEYQKRVAKWIDAMASTGCHPEILDTIRGDAHDEELATDRMQEGPLEEFTIDRTQKWIEAMANTCCAPEILNAIKETTHNEEPTTDRTQEGSSCELRRVTILMNGSLDDIYNAVTGLLGSMTSDRRYTANIHIDECIDTGKE